jgi:hypothetical protein
VAVSDRPIASELIIRLSSNSGRYCPMCSDFYLNGPEQFEESCKHLFSHGLKCLHIGQETVNDHEGRPWHTTVAFFGL